MKLQNRQQFCNERFNDLFSQLKAQLKPQTTSQTPSSWIDCKSGNAYKWVSRKGQDLIEANLVTFGQLLLVNSLISGFSHSLSLGHMSSETSPSDTRSVDDEALLGSVSQHSRFVWPRRVRHSVHSLALPVLPRTHSQNKAHRFALLLAPQQLHVLSGTHCKYKHTLI